ncbi:hypothetical protein GLOIN_2v1557212 [Rhizophagus clarus]|uniref:F-box domain-containing protein n=1 Tax=Rhizophagus clarus TaxID=94130 RepID=A0A8H3MCM4_9GLOM|nr:hypothetical protein GLOIN_2v1557212 [Rhizophagus clarus]
MASLLSIETWVHIFNYLEARADLHSCLLVNRFWCRGIVHLLWEHPFSYNLTNEKFKSILKTYLLCLNKQSIQRLTESGIRLSMINKNPMFCYTEFLKDLVIDSIRFDICIYQLIIELKNNGKQKVTKIRKSREDYDIKKIQQKYSKECDIIFEELIKLICRRSNRIRSLSVSPCKMMDYMITLLRENNNPYFQIIKSFTFNSVKAYRSFEIYESLKVYELIVALSHASRDITHIRINNVSQEYQNELGDSLEILLNSQNNLRSLDLENLIGPSYYETILSKLKNPYALDSLSFKNINFDSISQQSLNSLTKLSQNLKTFKVALCLNCSLLCDAMKCSNLVEFTYETYKFGEDLEFLSTILKSSSTSLRYLDIFWIRDGGSNERRNLISCISECTKLTYLKLRGLNSEDLFSIWYGCKQLEVLSFFCSEQSDWNDSFEDLGRLLPCSLKVLLVAQEEFLRKITIRGHCNC